MASVRLRFAAASRPMPGERECGDQWAIETRGDETTLVLADGVGHGPAAAAAARRAVEVARGFLACTLADILVACHRELAGTRGAAITLLRCCARAGTLSHCGVGNVELAAVTRAAVAPIPTPGIVGGRAWRRKLVETTHALHPGDLLVAYTDGISSRVPLGGCALEPQSLADTLLTHHAKAHDDAACLVVRC